ncbi:MAG: MDR family MFS transporter [Dehalococcoidia bacterium]|nr:MDR family MFS transporter [Dehalococcoidia bacterium]
MTELSRRQKAVILVGLMMGLFLTSLNQTTVVTAMPRIVANLGGMHLYSWVFASYMLGSTCAVPICGKLSDLLGRRPVFVAGLALFTIASALNGFAQNMEQLVLFRGVQGLAAAAIMPLVMIMIGDIFPPSERGKFQGLLSGVWAVASVIGPLVGGFLVDNWDWRWVFFFNVPVGLVTIVVAFHALKGLAPPKRKPSIDYLGMFTFTTGIVSLLLGLQLGSTEYPWGSPQITGLLGAAAVLLFIFVLVERVVEEPILPLPLLKNPVFAVTASAAFFTGIAIFSTITFAPLLLQAVLGTSATRSGVLMMPQALGLVIGSTLGGFIIARTGYRIVIWIGTAFMAIGIYLLTLIGTQSRDEVILISMTVMGLGWGATGPTFTTIVQNTVEHAQIGIATSSVQFFRQIGATLGITLMGAFLTLRLGPAIQSRMTEGSLGPLTGAKAGGSLNAQALLDSATAASLPPSALEAVRNALAASLNELFYLAAGAAVLSFVFCLFLKEVPLKKQWKTDPSLRRGDS